MYEKNVLAFFLVEHHVIREKGRIGKDQVINFLRTDVPSSQYNYARPDIFRLQVNEEPRPVVVGVTGPIRIEDREER